MKYVDGRQLTLVKAFRENIVGGRNNFSTEVPAGLTAAVTGLAIFRHPARVDNFKVGSVVLPEL